MVYELALVIDKDAYPYYLAEQEAIDPNSGRYTRRPVPNLNILATCRQIYIEASPIPYMKNMFYLPVTPLTVKFFAMALHSPVRRSWVKKVKLNLTPNDLTIPIRKEIFAKAIKRIEKDMTGPTNGNLNTVWERCGKDLHEAYRRKLLRELWPQKVECVLQHLKLDKFWLSIDSCYCDQMCCNLQIGVLGAFNMGFAHGMPKHWMRRGRDLILKDKNGNKDLRSRVANWTRLGQRKRITLKEGFRENEDLIQWMKRAPSPGVWGNSEPSDDSACYDSEEEDPFGIVHTGLF